MSAALTFMMGQFAAEVPSDRRYAKNHMWARAVGDQWQFGFSAYAVRLLQDVYFLDWIVDAPVRLRAGQEIGAIESKKAESSLYAPIGGLLTEFNQTLLKDPSAINVQPYGSGWLFCIRGAGHELVQAEQYIDHLAAVWKVTQKTIKGQLNQ